MSLSRSSIASVNSKNQEEIMKEMVTQLLQKMEANGFKTTKGTNTFTLANIVADFTSKIIEQRKHDLGALGLWGSNDLSVIVPILFARYRIYNTRHQPSRYNVDFLIKQPQKMGEKVPGYPDLVTLSDGSPLAALAKTERFQIHRLDNKEPTPLGFLYDSIFAGSKLKHGNLEFYESFMTQTGVYIENDFIILPNEVGEAVFYPITNFGNQTDSNSSVLELTLLVKHSTAVDIALPEVFGEVEVTPDFLKFTLTQMMARFPIFRGISKHELLELLREKYNVPVIWLSKFNEISVDVTDEELENIKDFAHENLYKDEAPVTFSNPGNSSVTFKCQNFEKLGHQMLSKFENFLRSRCENGYPIWETESVVGAAFRLVDEFFATEFLLDANFIKSQHPVKIEYHLDSKHTTKVALRVENAESGNQN